MTKTGRRTALVLLVATGVLAAYLAARSGGPGAAALVVVALGCGVALLARSDRAESERVELADVFDRALLALPGALIVFFGFKAGGYFPDAPAIGALALVVLLVLRMTLVDQPLIGFGRALAVATAALGLLSLWILASALWSDAPARALVEFDRAFVYVLVLVICGSVVRNSMRLRAVAASIAGGVLVVAVVALATRLAPDYFPTSIPAIGESNLAYPLTYSNALGILCVLGAIICLYFAASVQQPRALRAIGSAALPILAVTVYLTLSRGPVAAAIIGIGSFLVLGRPRGLLSAALATVPTSIVAIAVAYHHPVLTSANPQSADAAAQGHRVAWILFICAVAAAGLRLALTPLDARLRDYSLPPRTHRPVIAGAWSAATVALVVFGLAIDGPGKISDQYHRFVNSGQASPTQDVRQSVFSSANRGIVDNWSVALDAFKASPLHGQGAASYENYWNQHRPARQAVYGVVDGHSLYLEVLGELGIVGLGLLLIVLGTILFALLPLRSRGNRQLYAALFSVVLAWCAHAGVDWDWEMPAVTVIVFGIGGAALATHERMLLPTWATQGAIVGFGVALLAAAITPLLILVSQRDLNDARDQLRNGNCARAITRSADSINTLAIRPEPYEILAICQQRRGRAGLGIEAMRAAVDRDPHNWRYHYELGVLLGGVGRSPRPQLLDAQRLNPTNRDVAQLLKEAPPGEGVNWNVELQGPGGATATKR